MSANNVTRFLDSRNIQYSVFDLPPKKLGAEEVARLLNVAPEIVFKSIVISRKERGKPILAVVPGNRDVDLKALAKFIGVKKVVPATQKEAENITKLKVGGISPLILINRGFEILIHETIRDFKEVHISGGELGVNIRLPSQDLIDLTRGRVARIC
jgi:Cys-tRNA(Pro)/Cys-tRNA(Cys) deacylase